MSININPILLDFPDYFETERLLVRAPRAGDGREVNAAILESLAELRPWMTWAAQPPSVDDTELNNREAVANFILRTDLRFYSFIKGTATLAVTSGLHRMNWSVPSFEIGYWVRTSYAGQGYVHETVMGLTDFAFTHLAAHRVEIRCGALNSHSRRVAERAGFTLDALFLQDSRTPDGELRDTMIFAKTR